MAASSRSAVCDWDFPPGKKVTPILGMGGKGRIGAGGRRVTKGTNHEHVDKGALVRCLLGALRDAKTGDATA